MGQRSCTVVAVCISKCTRCVIVASVAVYRLKLVAKEAVGGADSLASSQVVSRLDDASWSWVEGVSSALLIR